MVRGMAQGFVASWTLPLSQPDASSLGGSGFVLGWVFWDGMGWDGLRNITTGHLNMVGTAHLEPSFYYLNAHSI